MSTVPGRRPNQIEPINHKFIHANNKVYPCASKLEMADQSALSCPLSQTLQEAFEKLGFNSVKPEQQLAVAGIMKGDVFVILPTGFGKSACYQCLPLVYDKICPQEGASIVIVVTPLKAIMKDQVSFVYQNNYLLYIF